MSKRILTVVLAIGTLASSSAFASRATDLVLGTGDGGVVLGNGGSSGTFYTDDAYNMFYNPAYVNDYKNWAIIEKSNFTNAGPQNTTTVGATTTTVNTGTTAQGGFVTGIGNFNLALFFNRQDDLMHTIYSNTSAMRPIDVLLGGDTGMMKWGLGFTYASFTGTNAANTSATKASNDWVIHAGAEVMDLDPFINWRIAGTDNQVSGAPSNKGGQVGLRYHWGEWTPYAVYNYESYNSNTLYRAYGVGLGRTMKASDSVKLMYNVAYFRQSEPAQAQSYTPAGTTTVTTVNGAAWNGTATAGDRSVIPLTVAVEGDANSWLTLMGGISYNLLDHVNGVTATDNTTGRIGAIAHAGKVDVDFAVGNGAATGAANEAVGTTDAQAFDFSHNFFSAASVQYHW